MIEYGFVKKIEMPFKEAVEGVTEELKKEGFGILTKIDVKAKLEEKLGIEFMDYVILGACNPPLAYQAIQTEENIGLMLPCNVIVYRKGGDTVVSVIKPSAAMGMINNGRLNEIAKEVERKLKRVFDLI